MIQTQILLGTIIILSMTILYLLFYKKLEQAIEEGRKERERQEVQRIHNIIEAYLKDMIKDE